MERFHFHTTVHALPPEAAAGDERLVDGRSIRPLHVQPAMLAHPLPLSFEEASRRLEQLPRMYLEPDGSFVWVSSAGDPAWQVDGVLYDRAERLIFVDLRGECTAEALDQLLAGMGADKAPVMFQLVRQAIFLDQAEFRRFCRVPAPDASP